MEVSGSVQDLGDSFSYGWLNHNQAPPSFDRLAADAGQYSFGGSRPSFIDMEDPAELFSMRWTTATAGGFDFGLPVPGGGAASPAQLVSASQIFRGGRLLPCEPGGCSQQDGDIPVARRTHTHLVLFLSVKPKARPGSAGSDGGQGGGRAPGREPLLGAPAHRHGGAGRRRGREGLQGAAPGALLRGRGAHLLVLLPGGDRRVPGHLPLPLHLGAHRDGRGGQPVGVQVRHRGHPGHRMELRRHDLRARLLHRRHLRRPHQPRGHLRAVLGQEAVAHQGRLLHRDAVPGCHMRRRRGQGVPDHAVPGQRRRRQLRRAGVHQGGRAGRRDRRHVRAGVHRLLRHRRQAQRQRLPRPHPGAAAHRVRGVPGAPGDDPHHGHRHQPGEVARRRHHLQQEAGVGRPLDLLGGSVHRRGAGGDLPRGGDPRDPLQEPRLVSRPAVDGILSLFIVDRDHVVVVARARVRGSSLGRARRNNSRVYRPVPLLLGVCACLSAHCGAPVQVCELYFSPLSSVL